MEKVIIITGASRGIGRNIAITLAKAGYKIIANYNNSEKEAKNLQEELRQNNIEIDIVKADVSKRKEVKNLVQYTLEKYKKIDVLINNAGISEYKLFTDETDEDWQRVINTNLFSAFAMSQEVLPNMIYRKEGLIINISSIWGISGGALEVLYSISKAGLDGLTKALAKEVGPSGIRVNSIAPGTIQTQMNEHLSKVEIENIKEQTPLEKIGKPEDISKCIKWLIEDEYTTGQVISINGGYII
jgi:3-oxoacyl-[acyl-carrier protein] reductase